MGIFGKSKYERQLEVTAQQQAEFDKQNQICIEQQIEAERQQEITKVQLYCGRLRT